MLRLAALLALATPAGEAIAQVQSLKAAPVIEDNAQRLALAVLPTDTLLAARLPRFEVEYAEVLKADKKLAALELKHAGITRAVAAAAKDEARASHVMACAALQADAAALYRKNFTPPELLKLLEFFRTPTGQMLASLSAGSRGDSADDFEANRRAKILARLQNPDEQTKVDLMLFVKSGLLPKVQAIGPEISALSARRFGDLASLVDAALEARIKRVIADYVAGKR